MTTEQAMNELDRSRRTARRTLLFLAVIIIAGMSAIAAVSWVRAAARTHRIVADAYGDLGKYRSRVEAAPDSPLVKQIGASDVKGIEDILQACDAIHLKSEESGDVSLRDRLILWSALPPACENVTLAAAARHTKVLCLRRLVEIGGADAARTAVDLYARERHMRIDLEYGSEAMDTITHFGATAKPYLADAIARGNPLVKMRLKFLYESIK